MRRVAATCAAALCAVLMTRCADDTGATRPVPEAVTVTGDTSTGPDRPGDTSASPAADAAATNPVAGDDLATELERLDDLLADLDDDLTSADQAPADAD